MPAYEFFCERCGPFELRRSFNEVHHAASCPTCQSNARRVYTPLGLVKTSVPLTRALDRAQKSAYEPEMIKRRSSTGENRTQGSASHSHNGRPWQIGH